MFIIAFVFSHLLFLYSYKFKKTALWGNLLVSITTAMAFIYGGESVLNAQGVLFPAGFAFFFHLGREILKDIEDMEGDYKAGALTFPIKYGMQASLNLIFADFILLVILTLIPYILGIYSVTYFIIVCLGIYPVLIFVMLKMRQKPGAALIGKLSILLKADMIVGLLAIYIS
jgi:geranylgeranylglycerol-phosphate geranylgeranyltransferase